MGCGNEISDWDDKAVQDSIAGKNTGIDPKVLEETRPAVEAAIDRRCMECLKEDAENDKIELEEKIAQSGREPTFLEKLDLEVNPTKENRQEMFEVSKELGLNAVEILSNPLVCGTENVRDISGKIRDVIISLHNSKINPEIWSRGAINRVMFIDAETARTRGINSTIGGFAYYEQEIQNLGLPRILHIVLDGADKLKTNNDIPEKTALLWLLAHEACHLNCHLPRTIGMGSEIKPGPIWGAIADNSEKWYKACNTQIKTGRVSDYAEIMLQGKQVDFKPENLPDDEEFLAENFAAWATNSPQLCQEMNDFFEEHFAK